MSRKNYSPNVKGHPHYVFGEKNGKYKSLGLTHSPKPEVKHYGLSVNPNADDSEPSYLQTKVHTSDKKYFGPVLQDWKFSKEDMYFVRHRIKSYKKSQNRGKRKRKK